MVTSSGAVAGLVLAAGRSSRSGPIHKLMAVNQAGTSLLQQTLNGVLRSELDPVWLVTGHQAPQIENSAGQAALRFGRELNVVYADDYHLGVSASLRAGLCALPAAIEAVTVCLADMPFVRPETIDQLIAARGIGRIVIPTYKSDRGNPVLWDRCFVAELMELSGDQGGRLLFSRHPDRVKEIPVEDEGVLQDCDTIEAIERWTAASFYW